MIDLDRPDISAFVKTCSDKELKELAALIRKRIINVVGKNGGHLASSLGAVELCIALHRVFDLENDPVFFDVGHQSYAHKILSGRNAFFEDLRGIKGCSGFPNPEESSFDPAAAGHAGVAVSLALGRATAKEHNGDDGVAIAVVGDGSMGCGVSFEGLNSAKSYGKKLIVILNDNQMAISPNVGGLSKCLNRLISGEHYNRFRRAVKHGLSHFANYRRLKRLINRLEDLIKGLLLPPGILFQELGLRYMGPVDGNNLDELIPMLSRVSLIDGPVLLHITTRKGAGYSFAEESPRLFHGVSGFDVENGALKRSAENTFSAAFGNKMCELGSKFPKLEAVSAAMISGTGLDSFSRRYPLRCHDVGIAEEHAVVFSAGLASGGRIPVCAIYSTFLQRAFDCIYTEVVLNRFPVIFAIDRAGAVEDGPTHHGIYDLGFLRQLPGFTIMTPANETELEEMMDIAVSLEQPCAIRYPRGSGARRVSETDVQSVMYGRNCVIKEGASDIVIWALGPEIDTALEISGLLQQDVTIISVRFIYPFDAKIAETYRNKRHFTIEDHVIKGGLYSTLSEFYSNGPHGVITPFGWPADCIVGHGKVKELRNKYGMSARCIAEKIKNMTE